MNPNQPPIQQDNKGFESAPSIADIRPEMEAEWCPTHQQNKSQCCGKPPIQPAGQNSGADSTCPACQPHECHCFKEAPKETPQPGEWRVGEWKFDEVIEDGEFIFAGRVLTDKIPFLITPFATKEEAQQTAARIVATVNFCAGVTIDTQITFGPPTLRETLTLFRGQLDLSANLLSDARTHILNLESEIQQLKAEIVKVNEFRETLRAQYQQEKDHHEFYRQKVSDYMGAEQQLKAQLEEAKK